MFCIIAHDMRSLSLLYPFTLLVPFLPVRQAARILSTRPEGLVQADDI